jgi:hypothetical protein
VHGAHDVSPGRAAPLFCLARRQYIVSGTVQLMAQPDPAAAFHCGEHEVRPVNSTFLVVEAEPSFHVNQGHSVR